MSDREQWNEWKRASYDVRAEGASRLGRKDGRSSDWSSAAGLYVRTTADIYNGTAIPAGSVGRLTSTTNAGFRGIEGSVEWANPSLGRSGRSHGLTLGVLEYVD